jgi:hypothetical protein
LATGSILEVRDKKALTQRLILQLESTTNITLQQAMSTWWFNIRKTGGMRLTASGFTAFTTVLDLARYEWVISNPHQINQHVILALDRKLQMPYYILATKGIPRKIIFFGSEEAVWINLYGNIKHFLENYKS